MPKKKYLHSSRVKKTTRKLLPQPDKINTLSKYGYNVRKNVNSRHLSLRKASKKYSPLSVLRRVNLIRNFQKGNNFIHQRMSDDVDYMKKLYKKSKLNF